MVVWAPELAATVLAPRIFVAENKRHRNTAGGFFFFFQCYLRAVSG